jgi:hypothetical protein
MSDRPIIFSAPMVRALIDGRKTQTRRVLKPQPVPCLSWSEPPAGTYPSAKGWSRLRYAPGDRLYVREAFSYETLDVDRNGFMAPWYWADGNPVSGDWTRPKPSIHMPRWASRLTLTVTEVKVQRLTDISEADAVAEGVRRFGPMWGVEQDSGHGAASNTAAGCFRLLWNSLHGPDAWDANPWVAAISFTVEPRNIDGGRQCLT